MQTLQNISFKGQRAVIRVDFNVPINEQGKVTDRTRIEAAKPTIDYIRAQGGSCVLLSHLGRPKGNDPKMSLKNIVSTVSEVLETEVQFCATTVGETAEKQAALLNPGEDRKSVV